MMVEKPGESGDKQPMRGGKQEPVKRGYDRSQNWSGRRAYKKKPIIQQPKFEGKCAELKNFIYNCSYSKLVDILYSLQQPKRLQNMLDTHTNPDKLSSQLGES
jgi:hypothetical protein